MSDETPEIAAVIAQPMPLEPELDEARKELVALIEHITQGQDGTVITAVPGLQVFRISKPEGPKHGFASPALGLMHKAPSGSSWATTSTCTTPCTTSSPRSTCRCAARCA